MTQTTDPYGTESSLNRNRQEILHSMEHEGSLPCTKQSIDGNLSSGSLM
jgi:hypothetical protein